MGNWMGLSLSFARQVRMQGDLFPDANTACEASGPLSTTLPAHVGAICWYDAWPFGNVAVSVGVMLAAPHVLGINEWGDPAVMPYNSPQLGHYIGWTYGIGGDTRPNARTEASEQPNEGTI